ncbi:hypothetical protein K9U39_06340 [Rhodoblastus acidophilus]|uniref:Uncharacterized protein n=1 Tax=Candidatus Rhodoblastus alkanivorans TaxID=2954117 RepID=A0ABS9Z6L2_9HYPH|nr:hypothetical protein [Candidatus Rhodoblastus alkanivorans]MCI4679677.1 hypothetical protein [Candidatus Rhodoblastus alkanivorans]MCI4683261.1 hypothetical protein [Candidatus Rhodoblastus alkanivorans]MDI4640573.1 hypothetical protein [Rhodoblastus acidophilus]
MNSDAPFETSHLDLALTKVAAGRPVLYRGPHQGVFRFESVKIAALRRFRASARPASVLGKSRTEEARLRKFLAGV